MLRKSHWFWIAPLYWSVAFYLLWKFIPPSGDGGGVQATFYWGLNLPYLNASWHDFDYNWGVRFWFFMPYWVAALIITLMGGVATHWLVGRFSQLSAHPFLGSCGVALLLMLLSAAAADEAVMLRLLYGGTFCCHFYSMYWLLKVAFAMSLLSGVVTLATRIRLAAQRTKKPQVPAEGA